jgi:hypothetical protein
MCNGFTPHSARRIEEQGAAIVAVVAAKVQSFAADGRGRQACLKFKPAIQ